MLFQKTILKKYLGLIDEEVVKASWKQFQAYFLDVQIQANIQQSKEEQFQEGFLRELFVKVLHQRVIMSASRLVTAYFSQGSARGICSDTSGQLHLAFD